MLCVSVREREKGRRADDGGGGGGGDAVGGCQGVLEYRHRSVT